MIRQIIVGDARECMQMIPPNSIDTAVTSPPYFRLRNYQHQDQLGLEVHVDDWVHELLLVARGLARVLKESGSLWLNLGDTYSRSSREGASPKSLLLAPERLATALVQEGWLIRNKVVWSKPNPMPTSVRDRLACSWEVLYFFVRSPRYFFDLNAIRVPHKGGRSTSRSHRAAWSVPVEWRGPSSGSHGGLDRLKAAGLSGHPLGKNPGDVWSFATAGFRGAHHAVFPERLIERPILATCPAQVCRTCDQPRSWCRCIGFTDHKPGIVLDPFIGSGTTAVVAERLKRNWIGIELNEEFAERATQRIASSRSLTTEETKRVA